MMLFGRSGLIALAGFTFLAACGDRAETPADPSEPSAAVTASITASDEVAGLSANLTGVDFWTHPNVAFNSMIIAASAEGLASYNVEDGSEVSSVPGIVLDGAAVSYIGFGPAAAGIVAAFDVGESVFRFYGVDNGSRLFIPLPGGPEIRGALRDFCMGRAEGVPDPTLFAVQRGELHIFNLTPNMNGGEAGVSVNGRSTVDIPESVAACAVDADGVVVLGAENGEMYRLAGENSFAAPFARTSAGALGELAVIFSARLENDASTPGYISTLNNETGIMEFFDREDGRALGAVRIDDSIDIEGVDAATAFAASGANLGGLYRNGAVAIAVPGETSAIRLIPANGVANALSLAPMSPGNPRGLAPAPTIENNLIIEPDLTIDPEN